MKAMIFIITLFAFSTAINAQTKKIEDAIWWEIAEECFDGTGIQNHNSLFLGVDNEHHAGSIFKKRLNSVGRMLHPILLFDYENVAGKMPNYPKVIVKEIKRETSFQIKNTKEYQSKLVHVLLRESALQKICPEMYGFLNASIGTNLTFINWGTAEFSKDEFEDNLQANKKEDFAKETRNGERYVGIKSIWMKKIKISFNMGESKQGKLNELNKEHRERLSTAGIELNNNELIIEFKEKYYPFCILGEITKIVGLKSFKGIVIEPDFNKYNNLIKYKPSK